MRILITSGGTKVPIDSVRHIGNMSSGTMGRKIATAALCLNHSVDFFSSKDGKKPSEYNMNLKFGFNPQSNEALDYYYLVNNKEYKEILYVTYQDYHDGLLRLIQKNKYDAIILCAAVSDYIVKNPATGKISSDEDNLTIELVKAPKLLPLVKQYSPDSKVVGFKMLSGCSLEELEEACRKQMSTCNNDMVVGNDIEALRSGKYYQLHLRKSSTCDYEIKKVVDNFGLEVIRSLEELVK